MDRFLRNRPSSALRDLQVEADQFLADLFRRKAIHGEAKTVPWGLRTDVLETGDGYRVRVELPGVDPETLEVGVEDRRVTIRGECREATQRRAQRRSFDRQDGSHFYRSIALPVRVNPEDAVAVLKNGILIVDLSKAPCGGDASPRWN